jgi:hypothetical protein
MSVVRQRWVAMPRLQTMNDGGCSLVFLFFCSMDVGGSLMLGGHASAANDE